ncbi:MAG TPA: hypothetical protein VGM03_19500 [Phycisphaerae bacterium]
MSRMRKLVTGLLIVCLWLPGRAAGQNIKEALSVIPADAVGFVCLPSIKQFDADYQQMLALLALQGMVQPPFNSLSSALKAHFQMTSGLNENGALAVVFLPADNPQELLAKLAFVVPTTDAKALLEAMGGKSGEGGIWNVSMMGQPAFAATTAKHVVIAQSAEVAKTIAESKTGIDTKLQANELKALEGLDLAVWLDADRLMKLLKPQIEGFFAMMQTAQRGSADPELFRKMYEPYITGLRSITMGLALSKPGLGLRFSMTVKPGSDLAKQTKLRTTSESLLVGVPDDPYLLAMGQFLEPATVQAAIKQMDQLFVAGIAEAPEQHKEKITALRNQFEEWATLITGVHGSVVSLSGSSNGLGALAFAFDVTDSEKWISAVVKIVDTGKELAASEEEAKAGVAAVTHKADAEEIEGIKVHHFRFDPAKVEQIGWDEEDARKLTKLLGSEGILVRVAPVEKNLVTVTFGGGAEFAKRAIGVAKAKQAPLDRDPGIRKVAEQLPRERASVVYIAVDQIISTIREGGKLMGEEEEFPIQMPKLQAPLAMSGTGGENWVQFDLFAPSELLVAGKNAAMLLMGGGAPPPPKPDGNKSGASKEP